MNQEPGILRRVLETREGKFRASVKGFHACQGGEKFLQRLWSKSEVQARLSFLLSDVHVITSNTPRGHLVIILPPAASHPQLLGRRSCAGTLGGGGGGVCTDNGLRGRSICNHHDQYNSKYPKKFHLLSQLVTFAFKI